MNSDPSQIKEAPGSKSGGGHTKPPSASRLRTEGRIPAGKGEELAVATDAVLEQTLRWLSLQLHACVTGLWLNGHRAERLVCQVILRRDNGRSRQRKDGSPKRYLPDWIARETIRSRQLVVCDDVEQDPRTGWQRSHLLAQGIRTVMAVPLLKAGRVMGLLGICGARPGSFREWEAELAQLLAQQAAVALQFKQLVKEVRRAAAAEERSRLARDLHDIMAHGLTGIVLQLEAAQEAIRSSTLREAEAHMRRATELARRSLGEAGEAVGVLRAPAREDGNLRGALQRLLEEGTAGTGVRAKFRLEGRERRLPAEFKQQLLRISQEALTNTLRHACADRFDACLAFGADEIRLDLCDNGRGFNPHSHRGGLGLKGMRERAARIGARLSVRSLAEEGTGIRVVLHDGSIKASDG